MRIKYLICIIWIVLGGFLHICESGINPNPLCPHKENGVRDEEGGNSWKLEAITQPSSHGVVPSTCKWHFSVEAGHMLDVHLINRGNPRQDGATCVHIEEEDNPAFSQTFKTYPAEKRWCFTRTFSIKYNGEQCAVQGLLIKVYERPIQKVVCSSTEVPVLYNCINNMRQKFNNSTLKHLCLKATTNKAQALAESEELPDNLKESTTKMSVEGKEPMTMVAVFSLAALGVLILLVILFAAIMIQNKRGYRMISRALANRSSKRNSGAPSTRSSIPSTFRGVYEDMPSSYLSPESNSSHRYHNQQLGLISHPSPELGPDLHSPQILPATQLQVPDARVAMPWNEGDSPVHVSKETQVKALNSAERQYPVRCQVDTDESDLDLELDSQGNTVAKW